MKKINYLYILIVILTLFSVILITGCGGGNGADNAISPHVNNVSGAKGKIEIKIPVPKPPASTGLSSSLVQWPFLTRIEVYVISFDGSESLSQTLDYPGGPDPIAATFVVTADKYYWVYCKLYCAVPEQENYFKLGERSVQTFVANGVPTILDIEPGIGLSTGSNPGDPMAPQPPHFSCQYTNRVFWYNNDPKSDHAIMFKDPGGNDITGQLYRGDHVDKIKGSSFGTSITLLKSTGDPAQMTNKCYWDCPEGCPTGIYTWELETGTGGPGVETTGTVEVMGGGYNIVGDPNIVYVDGSNGQDYYTGSSWVSPFKTIQHAIDAKGQNPSITTIYVKPSQSYYESLNIDGINDLSIIGILDERGVPVVHVDDPSSPPVVPAISINNSTNIVISGLYITQSMVNETEGGPDPYGGCVKATNNYGLTLSHLDLSGADRGLYLVDNYKVLLSDCYIHNCTSTMPGGGIYLREADSTVITDKSVPPGDMWIKLEKCEISSNDSTDSTYPAGGIGLDVSSDDSSFPTDPITFTISKCNITNNSTPQQGSGITTLNQYTNIIPWTVNVSNSNIYYSPIPGAGPYTAIDWYDNGGGTLYNINNCFFTFPGDLPQSTNIPFASSTISLIPGAGPIWIPTSTTPIYRVTNSRK